MAGENIGVTGWWHAALLLASPAQDAQEEDKNDEGHDQQKLGEEEGSADVAGNHGAITVDGQG